MTSVAPAPAQPHPRLSRARRRPPGARRDGVAARGAALAAAAALGALVGLGVRSGASLGRLGVVTLRLRGLPEFVAPDRHALGAALLGGLHVAAVAGVWGAAAAAGTAAARRRAHGATTAVALFAGLAALTALAAAVDVVLPTALRLAAGALTRSERVLVAALAVACGGAVGWPTARAGGDE